MKLFHVRILRLLFSILLLPALLVGIVKESVLFLLCALVLWISIAILDYQYWRCPKCGEHMGKGWWHLNRCKRCEHLPGASERVNASYFRKQAKEGYPDEKEHRH